MLSPLTLLHLLRLLQQRGQARRAVLHPQSQSPLQLLQRQLAPVPASLLVVSLQAASLVGASLAVRLLLGRLPEEGASRQGASLWATSLVALRRLAATSPVGLAALGLEAAVRGLAQRARKLLPSLRLPVGQRGPQLRGQARR